MKIYVFDDPVEVYDGLALEQTLLFFNMLDTMLFWRSVAPTVVIGRNQHPWLECNFQYILSENIAFARRDTGGGTVYHDTGNLNVSILSHITHNQVRSNLSMAQRVLSSFCIDTHVTDNNDVMVNGKKISGSAMRYVNNTMLHHFTLLLDANLTTMHHVLAVAFPYSIDTAAVRSKRSNVGAIEITASNIIEAYVQAYYTEKSTQVKRFVTIHDVFVHHPKWKDIFLAQKHRLKSSTWQYGRTPKFSLDVSLKEQVFNLVFEHGMLTKCVDSEHMTNILDAYLSHNIAIDPERMNTIAHSHENGIIKGIATELHRTYYGGIL